MKKMKIEFNYQTAKIALYTLLVLDIISFSNFSESKAKYYKAEPNVLSWDASLYQMYKENRIMLNKPNYETSTLTTADFTFSFPRNVIGSFKEKDEYEIILPTGCTIQSVSSNGKVNGNKITYTNTNTNTSHVAMQCEVEKILKEDSFGQKFLDFDIEINEKIDSEAKFLYTDTHYQQLYDLYKANIPDRPEVEEVPPFKIIKESETNKYAIFMEWIEKYAKQFTNEKDIVQFVKDHTVENDYESVKNLLLPGLRTTYDKDTDSYVYTLSDNFVEYVKFNNDENKGSLRIITTTDTIEMETAFEFHLKEYLLKDYDEKEQEALFNLAVSYVKSIDERGIAHILIPDESGNYPTIPGLTVTENSKGQPVQEVLITESKFFDYAYNKLNKVIRISFSTSSIMRRTFRENLPIVYDDQTISAGTIQTLPTYAELNNSVSTNRSSATETKKSFSDYFILPDDDNNHNLLINVYSNVGNDASDEYNYAKVSILNYDNFVFTETRSKFSVYAKDKDTLIKFVEELDKVYNKTTVLTDADFIFGSSLFSIEYSTIKQSTPVNGGTGPDGGDGDGNADMDSSDQPAIGDEPTNNTDKNEDVSQDEIKNETDQADSSKTSDSVENMTEKKDVSLDSVKKEEHLAEIKESSKEKLDTELK